jgi:hypothetical protein
MDDEFITGLLQIGRHPAAHGAEPDKSDSYIVLGHPVALFSKRPTCWRKSAPSVFSARPPPGS